MSTLGERLDLRLSQLQFVKVTGRPLDTTGVNRRVPAPIQAAGQSVQTQAAFFIVQVHIIEFQCQVRKPAAPPS